MTSKKALKWLREAVGEETYTTITRELAGTTIYFPSSAEYADKEERNLQIKDDFYSGRYEIADLAKKYDLSISHIYKIIQSR